MGTSMSVGHVFSLELGKPHNPVTFLNTFFLNNGNRGHCWNTLKQQWEPGHCWGNNDVGYHVEWEWSESTVPLSHGYELNNLLTSPMLWLEECLWNFSVLQRVNLSNLVFVRYIVSSCVVSQLVSVTRIKFMELSPSWEAGSRSAS
jgi:hypothetical protein